MKRKQLLLAFLALTPLTGYSQWTRIAFPGIPRTFLTNTGDYLGVGTIAPVYLGNKMEVVSGGVMFRSTLGGEVRFENPNSEEGLSIHAPSPSIGRADIRFNVVQGLKIGCHAASGVVNTANTLTINNSGLFGVGILPVSDKFEINSGSSGVSGLRFSQLNSGSSAATTNDRCLSLDIDGRVTMTNMHWATSGTNVYNTNAGGVSIGSASISPTSRLSIFGTSTFTTGSTATLSAVNPTGQANGYVAAVNGNNYNLGYSANTNGGAFSTGGDFQAQSATTVSTGVIGVAKLSPNCEGGAFRAWQAPFSVGVSGTGEANHQFGSAAVGGNFHADEGYNNKGVNAEAIAGVDEGNYENVGVYANAEQHEGSYNYGVRSNAVAFYPNTIQNVGVWARAQATGAATINYGVYSRLQGGAGAPNPPTPTGAGSYAGYFYDNSMATGATGAAFFNGNLLTLTPGVTGASDRKFKKDVVTMDNVVDKIMKLSPVTYTFKDRNEFPSFSFPAGKQLGFIAQELEQVFPELVHECVNPAQFDDKGNKIAETVNYKGVSYTELIPILTKAIQEQQTQIEAQQKQIEELKNAIANGSGNSTGIDNKGNTVKGYLDQNMPNPFTQTTVINYRLPENANTAAIGVYDLNGREIKLLQLNAEPSGSVIIDGGSMEAGMYVYSLLINGAPFETKKMVLTSH